MTSTEFKRLSGFEQAKTIIAGQYKMTKKWAREFRREQGLYHRAYWTDLGWNLWRMSNNVLSIEEE